MPGKNPHRPEGKTHSDNEHMQAQAMSAGLPHSAPSDKERHLQDIEMMDRNGGSTQYPAEQQVGGSRPGVHSRVKEAIERRDFDE